MKSHELGRSIMATLRQNIRAHPVRTTVILVVTVAVVIAWMILVPGPDADGEIQLSRIGQPTTSGRSCPIDDPCQVTKENWQSPRHMKDRFDDGKAGDARGKVLPLSIRKMATAKWNETHKVKQTLGKDFDCGDHWWCGPLKVENCAIQFFRCVGDNLGWDNVRSIGFRCGGTALITGAGTSLVSTPIGGIVAAGVGGDVCIYDSIGSLYDWW